MNPSKHSLRRSVVSIAAGLTYHSGLLNGLKAAANRWESIPRMNGVPRIPRLRRRQSGNVQILTYHRVLPQPDEFLPATSVEAFAHQMSYLARSCRVLPLAEAVSALESGDVPDNAVVLTFDDGYRDNYDHAFPILRELCLPATVFLSTGVIGTDRILWHDRVFRAFCQTSVDRYRCFDLTHYSQRQVARKTVLADLKRLDSRTRQSHIAQLLTDLEVAEPERWERLMLDWDEVRQMARAGIHIGSHTVNHPILSRIANDEARREIEGSKRVIESELECAVDSFAYPNGRAEDYTEATKRILKNTGFRCAVTTRFGSNSRRPELAWDPYELRRGGPDDAETAVFATKLSLYKMTT